MDVGMRRPVGGVNVLDVRLPERPTEPPDVNAPTIAKCPKCGKRTATDSIMGCANCGDMWCEECAPKKPPYLADLMGITQMCKKPCCVLRAAHREIHQLREKLSEQRRSLKS